jgi:hypothetical protein
MPPAPAPAPAAPADALPAMPLDAPPPPAWAPPLPEPLPPLSLEVPLLPGDPPWLAADAPPLPTDPPLIPGDPPLLPADAPPDAPERPAAVAPEPPAELSADPEPQDAAESARVSADMLPIVRLTDMKVSTPLGDGSFLCGFDFKGSTSCCRFAGNFGQKKTDARELLTQPSANTEQYSLKIPVFLARSHNPALRARERSPRSAEVRRLRVDVASGSAMSIRYRRPCLGTRVCQTAANVVE